jgi:hypothetical protein
MMLSFFGNVVVAVLLVVTISYAVMLNARLNVLRNDRAKLEELVNGLTVAAQRAESGIAALHDAAEDTGRSLDKKIETGRKLRDDLSYMLESGTTIADRLEGTIRARRDEPKREPAKREPRLDAQAPRADAADPARPVAPSRAERELLRALAGAGR